MKNEVLFQRIKKLVATERRIGVEILDCLYEIEIRKAYAELRYDGLYTYCVKELGFTESQAYQRIQAMRALKDLPELKPKIEAGTLSVSAISKVQTHLRHERKSGKIHTAAHKSELFQAMENLTSREVDLKLADERGEKLKMKLTLEMDGELTALWKSVKDRVAHRSGGIEAEALKIIAREWLARNDPARKSTRNNPAQKQTRDDLVQKSTRSKSAGQQAEASPQPECSPNEDHPAPEKRARHSRRTVSGSTRLARIPNPNSRVIPAETRRAVWKRDEGKCMQCGSKHALEIDHRLAFALGGKTELENLRLLCRSCNRFAAIQTFGYRKIVARASP